LPEKQVPKGRPRKTYYYYYKVEPREPQNVECINCFRVFDLNANYRSLDKAIIDDKKFCPSCFADIMNPTTAEYYHNQDNIIL
jgi:hypothetical protein